VLHRGDDERIGDPSEVVAARVPMVTRSYALVMDQLNTAETLDALEEVWASLLEATEGLTEEQWRLPTSCPGWTVADQVAHLVGIERTLQGHPAPEVEIRERSHLKNPIAEMNEVWIEHLRSNSGDEVRAEFAVVTAERMAELRGLDEAAFEEIGWSPIGKVPMRTFMFIRVMDSFVHEQDARIALGRPGGRDGAGERVTLMRADAALGSVVGKGASAPEGASVIIDVTGPIGGRRRIEVVNGRATSVEGSDASVTISLTQETYLRRFAGRVTPAEALAAEGTTIKGDRALGEAVIASLSVVP
jgi:uncharacterized protein (TIGR03083 family)